MYSIAVKDIPKMTSFYADTLGLEVTQDYRQDEKNWWITLAVPGGVSITLALDEEGIKPNKMTMYFATADIQSAHKELADKGVTVSKVQDDLYGPGSGVKFVTLEDPQGNQVILVEE